MGAAAPSISGTRDGNRPAPGPAPAPDPATDPDPAPILEADPDPDTLPFVKPKLMAIPDSCCESIVVAAPNRGINSPTSRVGIYKNFVSPTGTVI